MSDDLRTALRMLAEPVPPVSVPDDLWRRGRRRRRRTAVAAAAAVLGVLAAATLPALGVPSPMRAGGDGAPAVPAKLRIPWMWQATVAMDPPGPATVLYSGDGRGLSGSDLYDHEGKIAAIGPEGHRMLLYGLAERVAGVDVQVSPDGRYVTPGHVTDDDGTTPTPVVTDLETGRNQSYPAGRWQVTPVAWRPDSRALLVTRSDGTGLRDDPALGTVVPGEYALFDVRTGATRPLAGYDVDPRLRVGALGAFSPDGARIALTVGTQLRLVDATGHELWRTDLGPDRHLAGTGAFTPDGRLIAVVRHDGCRTGCDASQLDARRWVVEYRDAATGRQATGPGFAAVEAMGVRLIGWAADTEPVVVRHEAQPGVRMTGDPYWSDLGYWESGHATVVVLRPGGGTRTVLDPPGEVNGVDIPLNLVRAGAFGGPAPYPSVFPARGIIVLPAVLFGVPLLVLALLARRRLRRWAGRL